MLVTLAESVSVKFDGSCSMFGQVRPIESIWIGSQLGHEKLLPVAPPTDSATLKFGPGANEPSPRNAKLVAEPVIEIPPTDSEALAEPKLANFWVAVAPVL